MSNHRATGANFNPSIFYYDTKNGARTDDLNIYIYIYIYAKKKTLQVENYVVSLQPVNINIFHGVLMTMHSVFYSFRMFDIFP